jgi:hypothetical protein
VAEILGFGGDQALVDAVAANRKGAETMRRGLVAG